MSTISLRVRGLDDSGISAPCALDAYAHYALKKFVLAAPTRKSIALPGISITQNESERARKRKITLNTNLSTFVKNVKSDNMLLSTSQENITEYHEFVKEQNKNNRIAGYSFNHRENVINSQVKAHIRQIQIGAPTIYFHECEDDIEQNVNSMIKQFTGVKKLLWQRSPNKILIPELSMKISDPDLFAKKLIALTKMHKRIDLKYGGSNAIVLRNWSKFFGHIKNSKTNTWFHMNGIPHRHEKHAGHVSMRVALYALGISSSSLGATFGGGSKKLKNGKRNKKIIYEFNPVTHRYDKAQFTKIKNSTTHHYDINWHGRKFSSMAEFEDTIWTESTNDEIRELNNMRNSVINKTCYSKYIPSKQATLAYSAMIKSRIK